jgi:hypothetical protein
MPNWCYNNLSVEIDTEYIDDIYDSIYNVFSKYLNLPENETTTYTYSVISHILHPIDFTYYKNLDDKQYIKSFVDECKDYGVARCNSSYNDSGDFGFESGWGPPTDYLLDISDKFKMINISINYEESGCDFGGEMVIHNGEIIEQDEWTLSEKNWKEYGGPKVVNHVIEIINDTVIEHDEGNEINLKTEKDIIQFFKKHNNALELIEDSIQDDLNQYAYEMDLENCEDKILNEFHKYINNIIVNN